MKTTTTGFFLLLGLTASRCLAQNVAGFWLGVTYPTDPSQAVYNYTMTLTQTGTALGGTAQTANPNVPFGGIAYLSGQVNGTTVSFSEADKNGSTAVKDICFWRGTLTYNPTDESLTGTYESIVNGTTCTEQAGGKVELYRIVLKSGDTFCKNSPVALVVTGKGIQWYDSQAKTKLLATGNTYSPKITQTTTFYITQTLYRNESPPVPITVKIVEPTFTTTSANSGCGKASGSITVTAAGSAGWQYSLNGGAVQASPQFAGLDAGTYTVAVRDAAGCRAEQTVTLTTESGPVISDLKTTPPRCETANGEVTVVATGGKAPLTYSIDYGLTYQADSKFGKLPGGTYTVRVRDANGCEVNKALNLPASVAMTLTANVKATTCGEANGRAGLIVAGGVKPIQYSLDGYVFGFGSSFDGLKAGTYTIHVRDGANCMTSQSVNVAASIGPSVPSVRVTPQSCEQQDGAILITSPNPINQFQFSLNGRSFQRGSDFSGLNAGSYTLVQKDNQNCLVTQTIVVPSDCPKLIHLPTAFSPNADNVNDGLTIYFRFGSLLVSRFVVYDRWGSVVYSRSDFSLYNGDSIWNGQVNGQAVQPGTYLYRLDCRFPDGTQASYRHSVALLN